MTLQHILVTYWLAHDATDDIFVRTLFHEFASAFLPFFFRTTSFYDGGFAIQPIQTYVFKRVADEFAEERKEQRRAYLAYFARLGRPVLQPVRHAPVPLLADVIPFLSAGNKWFGVMLWDAKEARYWR